MPEFDFGQHHYSHAYLFIGKTETVKSNIPQEHIPVAVTANFSWRDYISSGVPGTWYMELTFENGIWFDKTETFDENKWYSFAVKFVPKGLFQNQAMHMFAGKLLEFDMTPNEGDGAGVLNRVVFNARSVEYLTEEDELTPLQELLVNYQYDQIPLP
jgi:hypothetical protein